MKIGSMTEELALRLEVGEAHAWIDMYAAAPPEFARDHGLGVGRVDDVVVMRCTTIPFVHFVCALNLGVGAAATPERIDRITRHFEDAGIRSFTIFEVPAARPGDLPDWLHARGFEVRGGWDRIYRDAGPLPPAAGAAADAGAIEKVTRDTAGAWADFIVGVYGLPTKPWLLRLVERPGWHHYLSRRGGAIDAVRSMYVHVDGTAWLGIDAPVPGLMTQAFAPDAALCRAMVRDGLALGVRLFVADVEAPSPARDTGGHQTFAELGFEWAYLRRHFAR